MSEILARLRRIDEAHLVMAQCAEALDWEGLLRAWQGAETELGELTRTPLDHIPPLERDEARMRINSILRLQQSVSERVQPWMAQVAPLLESFSRHPLAALDQ